MSSQSVFKFVDCIWNHVDKFFKIVSWAFLLGILWAFASKLGEFWPNLAKFENVVIGMIWLLLAIVILLIFIELPRFLSKLYSERESSWNDVSWKNAGILLLFVLFIGLLLSVAIIAVSLSIAIGHLVGDLKILNADS